MTAPRKPYNGHPSWDYWNVALWFANDEGLYRLAVDELSHSRDKREAARRIAGYLQEWGTPRTPDGARYNIARVAHAIRDL